MTQTEYLQAVGRTALQQARMDAHKRTAQKPVHRGAVIRLWEARVGRSDERRKP